MTESPELSALLDDAGLVCDSNCAKWALPGEHVGSCPARLRAQVGAVVERAIAGAYRACAEHYPGRDRDGDLTCSCGDLLLAGWDYHILALTPADAKLAVDRLVADARISGLQRAMELAIEEINTTASEGGNPIRKDACDNVRILIRAEIDELIARRDSLAKGGKS